MKLKIKLIRTTLYFKVNDEPCQVDFTPNGPHYSVRISLGNEVKTGGWKGFANKTNAMLLIEDWFNS